MNAYTRFPTGPIWLIGCGNMAGAMLRRWLDVGLDPAMVTVVTRSGGGAPDGVRAVTMPSPDEVPAILLLGVKPQQLDDVAPSVKAIAPGLVISILAGVEAATLAARFEGIPVVRAMPNLPVAIGRGVVCLYADPALVEQRRQATALMTPLGLVEWIDDEAQFDAVTALAGCGPAFQFRFIDALAKAGVDLGLSEALALRMALATTEGAAAMAREANDAPSVLADRVASPKGSTREGLNVLDRDAALDQLMAETLKAAASRNREMAAEAKKAST